MPIRNSKVKVKALQDRKAKKNQGKGKAMGKGGGSNVTVVAKLPKNIPKAPVAPVVSKYSQVTMPECTLRFAKAIADPFSAEARGACIPVSNGSTKKVTAFARVNDFGGTTGFGLIYFCPCVSNDLPSFYYTNATWTGTTNTPFATQGSNITYSSLNSGWSPGFINTPYTTAACVGLDASSLPTVSTANTVTGKIVSAGCRVYYTGAQLQLGGTITCYQDPAHNSVAALLGVQTGSGITISQPLITSYMEASIEAASRDPCTLSIHPVAESELTFPSSSQLGYGTGSTPYFSCYPYSQNALWTNSAGGAGIQMEQYYTAAVGQFSSGSGLNVRIGCPIAGIYAVFPSGAGGGCFHFDYICHIEYQGAGANDGLTPNSSDIEGVNRVMSAAARIPSIKSSMPNMHSQNNWSVMKTALKEVWHMIKPVAMNTVLSLI